LSDGRKKEIYQYIRFFHGALQFVKAAVKQEWTSDTDDGVQSSTYACKNIGT